MGMKKDTEYFFERNLKVMDLFIETLQGTSFELSVSPFDTVQDVKARISKLEGIPISQQHLIWRSIELQDDCSLRDYEIKDGATLKLVPTMRVGPINTRRITLDSPSLVADYITEANREDLLDRLQSSRPLTVIIYNNGEQINFYRVVDRESSSPSVHSHSSDVEEEEPDVNHQKDNDKTRQKMKELKSRMEGLSLNRKLPALPPPSAHSSVRGRHLPPVDTDPLSSILSQARVSLNRPKDTLYTNRTASSNVHHNRIPSSTTYQSKSGNCTMLSKRASSRLALVDRSDLPHHLPPMTSASKKKTKRCGICNKKTGLANSFSCRCGINFCALHRYAELHNCTFDYKTEGRKFLQQNNPVVTAPKLPKI